MSHTIHASAVLVGASAILIRGPSGSGKSSVAFSLLEAAEKGLLPFARLVTDDRSQLESVHGRLLVRAPAEIAGLIEIRGIGIRRVPYEPIAVVSLVADLAAKDAERLPDGETCWTNIQGIRVPRLAVAPNESALRLILAKIKTGKSGS